MAPSLIPKFLINAIEGSAFLYRFTTVIFKTSVAVFETKFPSTIKEAASI